MNKQDSVDLLHPSMLQIQYLMELEKVGKKRGSVTMIADICGVMDRSVVSLKSAWREDI